MAKRKRYKLYDQDPAIAVPRSTLHDRKHRHNGTDKKQSASHCSRESCDDFVSSETEFAARRDEDARVQPPLQAAFDTSTHEDNTEEDNSPGTVHPASPLTKLQSIILVLTFILRHGLPDTALEDLLTLMNLLLPNSMPASKYQFYKFFAPADYEVHYYCKICQGYLGSDNDKSCGCSVKDGVRSPKNEENFFYYMPIRPQLYEMLKNKNVSESLKSPALATVKTLSDIMDGKLYQDMLRKKIITENDLTLLLNTDGVSIFKSSNFSIWPILATINELPQHLRKANILMAGLWFGNSKPKINTYLKPVVDELKILGSSGFLAPEGVTRKIFVLGVTADAPARAILRNCKQFNGMFGCDWCFVPGVRNGLARHYPFRTVEESRTDIKQRQLAIRATSLKECQKGVKGLSITMLLPHFNCVDGMVIDIQHAAFLGVVRQFVNSWFDSTNRSKPFYIGHRRKELDMRLLSVQPPSDISRAPRSFVERNYWKASEWRALLLYSSVIFQGVLPSAYFSHWLLFVNSMYVLMQESILPCDVDVAENYLHSFARSIENLYGIGHCTYNVHILTHSADCVRNMGPLHLTSTFLFEGFNRTLLKLFQGTQKVPHQICHTFLRWKCLSDLSSKCIDVNTSETVSVFYAKLLDRCLNSHFRVTLGNGFKLLGKARSTTLSATVQAALENFLACRVKNDAKMYERFALGHRLFAVRGYNRSKKHCNSHVMINHAAYKCGTVESVVEVQRCSCRIGTVCSCCDNTQYCLVLVEPYLAKSCDFGAIAFHSKYRWQVTPTNRLVCVQPKHVLNKCIFLECGTKDFFVKVPSKFYWD